MIIMRTQVVRKYTAKPREIIHRILHHAVLQYKTITIMKYKVYNSTSIIQRMLSEFWNLWLIRGALWTPLSDSAITTSRQEHIWCGFLKYMRSIFKDQCSDVIANVMMDLCFAFGFWYLTLKKTHSPPLPSTVVTPVDITIFLIEAAINRATGIFCWCGVGRPANHFHKSEV